MDEEDAQTAALQDYFDSNAPSGYGASFRAGWDAGRAWAASAERERVSHAEFARFVQEAADMRQERDKAQALAASLSDDWHRMQKQAQRLERLLSRAYPWLHNPYHGTSDQANAAEGDAVIDAVQFAIQHVPDEPDPLLNLPCASCDGDGCPNCSHPRDQVEHVRERSCGCCSTYRCKACGETFTFEWPD